MNLTLSNSKTHEHTYFAIIGGTATILFLAYYFMMRKAKGSKVRAQVEQNEYFIEKVKEDDALSVSNTF